MYEYCIKDAETMDIIADNLTQEEALEVLETCEECLGDGAVIMTYSETTERANEYKEQYIEYFYGLQIMGNLI